MSDNIAKLESQVRQLEADLSVLSEAMAEILAWSVEAERLGVIPLEIRSRAKVALKLSRTDAEIATLEGVLELLGYGDDALYSTLQGRLGSLREKRGEYRMALEGKDAS